MKLVEFFYLFAVLETKKNKCSLCKATSKGGLNIFPGPLYMRNSKFGMGVDGWRLKSEQNNY